MVPEHARCMEHVYVCAHLCVSLTTLICIQRWQGLKCPTLQSPHADPETCTSVLQRLDNYKILSYKHVTTRHIPALHMEPSVSWYSESYFFVEHMDLDTLSIYDAPFYFPGNSFADKTCIHSHLHVHKHACDRWK